MNFSLENLTQKLSQAKPHSSYGMKDVILEEITVGGVVMAQILLELDPGKELTPHLHEINDEVGMVITTGNIYFGDPKKENGQYMLDNEGRVVVEWGNPIHFSSGETFTIPAGKAHHFVAEDSEPLLFLLTLPKTHLTEEDRKFTTHP